jgi:hypothetical protein
MASIWASRSLFSGLDLSTMRSLDCFSPLSISWDFSSLMSALYG